MTQYTDGRRFEHDVRHDLETDGYWVIRAAGSKTKADLIAVKPGQVLVVQCKRNGKIGPAERAEVVRIAAMIDGGIPLLAWKEPRRKQPRYDRLTGTGPKDRTPFHTDEIDP